MRVTGGTVDLLTHLDPPLCFLNPMDSLIWPLPQKQLVEEPQRSWVSSAGSSLHRVSRVWEGRRAFGAMGRLTLGRLDCKCLGGAFSYE